MEPTTYYSQNREDIIIDAFFDGKVTGFYVDVGAGHPVEQSVTKLFYENGWRGINIEPNTEMFKLLNADRPEDINLDLAVSQKEGKAKFRKFIGSEGLSTLTDIANKNDEKFYRQFKQKFEDFDVETSSLAKILADQQIEKIDFLKIDVEGAEFDVLAGNDWKKYRPELICIEANHIIKNWQPILEKADYVKFFNDGLNDYYATKDSPHLATFSYAEKVLMKGAYMPFMPHARIKSVSELDFDTRIKKPKKKIAAGLKIKWSLVGLREATIEYLVNKIIMLKRKTMLSRAKRVLADSSDIYDYANARALTRSYMQPALLGWKVLLVVVLIVVKVSSKILRV